MVEQHFRWDFVGLSTDTKPTPTTSTRVVNGSTFYCADNSKLYIWYKTQWYEKTASSGTTYTAGSGIDITDNAISVDTTEIQPLLTAGTGIDITDNTISATGGTPIVKTLTTDDYNYPENNPSSVALWLLEDGLYYIPVGLSWKANSTSGFGTDENYLVKIRYDEGNSRKYITMIGGSFSSTTSGINEGVRQYFTKVSDGSANDPYALVSSVQIANNLTTISAGFGYVLNAYQGKVLKDLIDGLDARVSALEGN